MKFLCAHTCVHVRCCPQVWQQNLDTQALLQAHRGSLENSNNRRTKAMREMSIGDFFAAMKAYLVMAYTVMAYVVMAYIVMADIVIST